MSQYYDWGSWTTLVDAQVINHGFDLTSDAVSLDLLAGCEVSVVATYSNHAITQGVKVYVLRELDGTNYEGENDNPWGFEAPYVQNGTRNRVFNVDPGQAGGFKILLTYDGLAGSSVTVTVRYRTATIASS